MRYIVIGILIVIYWFTILRFFGHQSTKNTTPVGRDELPLTDVFRHTYIHYGSFDTPYFRCYEKLGMKVYIQSPDTLKSEPLILSDWKVTIEGNPQKKYRSGDWEKLPVEIQKLFWFDAK